MLIDATHTESELFHGAEKNLYEKFIGIILKIDWFIYCEAA